MSAATEDPFDYVGTRFHNGIRIIAEWDNTDRVYRVYNDDGTIASEEPYTDAENAAADAMQAEEARRAAAAELRAGLADVITRALERQAQVQAVIDTPNSEVNNKPAPYIMTLARASKRQERAIIRLARLAGGLLDSTDTGSD